MKIVSITAILLLLVLLNTTCKKFYKLGHLHDSGIALTFDDQRIDNWFESISLLDSFNVKATFYISGYNNLTPSQKAKLAEIRNRGHEIAYHSLNHVNVKEYLRRNNNINALLTREILPGLHTMMADGYTLESFAYPYGTSTKESDSALLKIFKSVRKLNGSRDFSKSLATDTSNSILYGLGIDKSSNRKDEDIIKLLESANTNKCCAVLVAHDIDGNHNLAVTKERLRKIFTYIKDNNMQFYTVRNLSTQ